MTSATDNRTTKLCEMLDELGIEHFDYDKGGRTQIMWESPEDMRHFTYETAAEPAKTAKLIIEWFPTPEQAIAATLGSDQELIDLAHNAWSMALCAMQGMPIPAEWGDAVERGLREHGIDVDDEKAGFEVIDDER